MADSVAPARHDLNFIPLAVTAEKSRWI